MTAFIAFVTAFIFASCISYLKIYGIVFLMAVIVLIILNNHFKHKSRAQEKEEAEILNLKKVKDSKAAISSTF